MGGESRLAYHGVPRILSGSFVSPQGVKIEEKKDWKN